MNHRSGFYVALVRAIENQNRSIGIPASLIEPNDQDVIDRIDGKRAGSPQQCIRTFDSSNGSNITVRVARKDPDDVVIGHEDFVVNRIHIQPVAADLRMRALDDPNGCFLSGSCSAKGQDRFRKRIHNKELVVYLVVTNIVHGSGELAGLAIYRSSWRFSAVRQPGERRNLRMSHSIGYQDLVALCVITDRSRISDVEGHLVRRSSADDSRWFDISVRRYRKEKNGMCAHAG